MQEIRQPQHDRDADQQRSPLFDGDIGPIFSQFFAQMVATAFELACSAGIARASIARPRAR